MTQAPLPCWTTFADLPRAHGEPLGRGRLRVDPADFQVEERLGFAPDGEGDHLLLWVRKTGANTEWAARRLATLAGASQSEIGYAGLKDRHAITSQWFSVPRPRDETPDWSALTTDGIEVLEVHSHRRKLRRGALAGNRFRLLMRDCALTAPALDARLDAIRARGVPNYFGEQRFGHADGNLIRAHALFGGTAGRVPRHQKGLWLSAARSQIFNQLLAERVRREDWDRPQPGDCLQLDGTHSHFLAETIDATLTERCARMDLHPSGPLWGSGAPPTRDSIQRLEETVAAAFPGWPEGLAAQRMDQERRALRLPVIGLTGRSTDEGLELTFELTAGAYATAVVRELMDWEPGS
ncbi:tRNA pseudouridine(13) synthase TruD [uncultured Thiocystis sp.]|jgi:tRNA pseudouridine13 synthase|uniref:tRNA pseudouridine(13) synthase TruD n=1 Tax=uncultured Thiocystis sp. TaxID=1202134 RepID=UPI0025FB62C2|nr:tRNA pseudouridine(13) synthase TruD [uncultured Thiocystis sp.]